MNYTHLNKPFLIMLHRFTASPLHRFTASPLHRFTASLVSNGIVVLFTTLFWLCLFGCTEEALRSNVQTDDTSANGFFVLDRVSTANSSILKSPVGFRSEDFRRYLQKYGLQLEKDRSNIISTISALKPALSDESIKEIAVTGLPVWDRARVQTTEYGQMLSIVPLVQLEGRQLEGLLYVGIVPSGEVSWFVKTRSELLDKVVNRRPFGGVEEYFQALSAAAASTHLFDQDLLTAPHLINPMEKGYPAKFAAAINRKCDNSGTVFPFGNACYITDGGEEDCDEDIAFSVTCDEVTVTATAGGGGGDGGGGAPPPPPPPPPYVPTVPSTNGDPPTSNEDGPIGGGSTNTNTDNGGGSNDDDTREDADCGSKYCEWQQSVLGIRSGSGPLASLSSHCYFDVGATAGPIGGVCHGTPFWDLRSPDQACYGPSIGVEDRGSSVHMTPGRGDVFSKYRFYNNGTTTVQLGAVWSVITGGVEWEAGGYAARINVNWWFSVTNQHYCCSYCG